jgi:hypothetical protein
MMSDEITEEMALPALKGQNRGPLVTSNLRETSRIDRRNGREVLS